MQQYPPAVFRQFPGQAIGVADGEHRQDRFPLRLKGKAVARVFPGPQPPDADHSGPEGEHGPQTRLCRGGCLSAVDTVQGDTSPGICAGLGRKIQDSIAGLDVGAAGMKTAFPKIVYGGVKAVELGLCVLRGAPVRGIGGAQVGEDPLYAQIFCLKKTGG